MPLWYGHGKAMLMALVTLEALDVKYLSDVRVNHIAALFRMLNITIGRLHIFCECYNRILLNKVDVIFNMLFTCRI